VVDPVRHIAIVGASLAGFRAAQALRREGFEGTITVIGGEAEAPYDRPPLSKRFLTGESNRSDLALARGGQQVEVAWRLSTTAVAFDAESRRIALASGDDIEPDGVILASGARPRRLPGPQPDGVHVLRTMADSAALRADLVAGVERLVVVGAGFIGAEVAATARSMGVEVTIVEALDLPLARVLPPSLGRVCADLHRDHGVDLRLGVGVDGLVARDGRVAGVRLADGVTIEAEVVLVGIGVVPNTEWLEGSGLTIDDGVVCDATTLAAPRVVAAGDVARWHNPRFDETMRVEHWDNAAAMGQHAARRLLAGDGPGEPFAPVPYFWSDQYDRKLQLTGRVAAGDTVEVIEGSFDERRFVALIGRGDRLVGAFAMNRPPAIARWSQRIADGLSWAEALQFAE
jgi:3-phenylpropionate/trans-cinnamate dioxygenase ferredoxin reductase component